MKASQSSQLPADRIKIFQDFFNKEKNSALKSSEDGVSNEIFIHYEEKIKRIIPLEKNREEQDVLINSKFSELSYHFSDFKNSVSYFGEEGTSKNLIKKKIKCQITSLQELELLLFKSPNRLPNETLMYFPRFINAAIQVFEYEQKTIDTCSCHEHEKSSKEDFSEQLFERSYRYLEDALHCAFVTRKADVQVKQIGARSEYIYLYDHLKKSYLTELILHCQETNKEFLFATDFIKDHLAIQYVQQLNIDGLFHLISSFSDKQRSAQDLVKQKELLILPYVHENMKKNNGQADINLSVVYSMFTPFIREKFFADFRHLGLGLVKLPQVDSLSFTITASTPQIRESIQGSLSSGLSTLIDRNASKGLKMLSVGALAACAPIASALLELIFPSPTPPTEEEIRQMIDDRIKHALSEAFSEAKQNDIKDKFGAALKRYNLFMNYDIPNLIENKDKDKSEWYLGKAMDWGHVIGDFNDLAEIFLNIRNHTDKIVQYHTHVLFSEFAAMYVSLLYGKILASVDGADLSGDIGNIENFLNRFYKYLKDLIDFSWNGTLDYNAIKRDQEYPILRPDSWRLIQHSPDGKAGGSLNVTRGSKEKIPTTLLLIETRCRFFALNNTLIRSLCEVYDVMAKDYNNSFSLRPSTKLPYITVDYLENTVYEKWYHDKMQKYYWNVAYTRRERLNLVGDFGFCGSHTEQEFYDATKVEQKKFYPMEDNFISITYRDHAHVILPPPNHDVFPPYMVEDNKAYYSQRLGVSDISSILTNGKKVRVTNLIVPRWFRVELYEGTSFTGKKHNYRAGKHNISIDVKSMKIRIIPTDKYNSRYLGSMNLYEMFGSDNFDKNFVDQKLINPLPLEEYHS